MSEPTIFVRKIATNMVVPQYLIDLYDKPYNETPEQRADRITDTNHQWALYDAALPALAAITDPASRAVLDLHAPNRDNDCEGCPPDYENGYEPWPCETTRVVAGVYGIELPSSIPYARVAIGPDPEPQSFSSAINKALSGLSFDFKPEEIR